MTDSVAERLKKFDFFSNLPDEVIHSLVGEVEKISLKTDEVLFNKGDMGDALYVVETGRVKMVGTDKDGQEVVFNQVGAGAVIGEMALIDQQPRSAGVIALGEVDLLKLSQEAFHAGHGRAAFARNGNFPQCDPTLTAGNHLY